MRKKALREMKRDGLTTHHTGYKKDRRADKLEGVPSNFRRYARRYGA